MLILLMPEQIAEHWEKIKERVMENIPPNSPDGSIDVNKILEAVLAGKLQLWFSVGEDDAITALCITEILKDPFAFTSTILLYAVFTLDGRATKLQEWVDGFATVAAFGKGKGCTRVACYSNNEKILRLAEHFKGDTSYRYITWEV